MRSLARFALGLAAGAISACGSVDDAYPAAVDTGTAMAAQLESETSCTPNEVRECRKYYIDEYGQQQCPLSVQRCNATGDEWSRCGTVGDSGARAGAN